MPNTSLPTNRAPESPGLISDANIVHGEINRLSRDTGWRNVRSLIRNGAKADQARLRRQDNLVILELLNLDVSAVPGVADGTPVVILTGGMEGEADISSNFINSYPTRGPIQKSVSLGFEMQLQTGFVLSQNTFEFAATFYTGRATGTARIQLQTYVDKDWPTFLPPAA